ncbi:hypothetical protein PIB30_056338 [Stylosanthes scabra]|uniref:Uncharacterized protein n=1 Tax=Stylosanthes scabra TaxID=79078 RepID=A0ABU6VIY2_9FABA|nr:hypothetical protein [Stylosanthes scabra]
MAIWPASPRPNLPRPEWGGYLGRSRGYGAGMGIGRPAPLLAPYTFGFEYGYLNTHPTCPIAIPISSKGSLCMLSRLLSFVFGQDLGRIKPTQKEIRIHPTRLGHLNSPSAPLSHHYTRPNLLTPQSKETTRRQIRLGTTRTSTERQSAVGAMLPSENGETLSAASATAPDEKQGCDTETPRYSNGCRWLAASGGAPEQQQRCRLPKTARGAPPMQGNKSDRDNAWVAELGDRFHGNLRAGITTAGTETAVDG